VSRRFDLAEEVGLPCVRAQSLPAGDDGGLRCGSWQRDAAVAQVCAGMARAGHRSKWRRGSSWRTQRRAMHVSHETIYTWFYLLRRVN